MHLQFDVLALDFFDAASQCCHHPGQRLYLCHKNLFLGGYGVVDAGSFGQVFLRNGHFMRQLGDLLLHLCDGETISQ